MNTKSIHKDKGIFAEIRNSPLFFIPVFLIVGYALASLMYILIQENDSRGNSGRQQVVAAAHFAVFNSGAADPRQADATISDASPEWKPDNPYQVISAVKVASANIYLFNSAKTRDYATTGGRKYGLILDQWHYYFHARGIKYIDLQEANLTPDLKPGILVLPSTDVLSSSERTAILAFEKNGGSVLATWAFGSRNAAGEWLGFDFLQDQFGIKVAGEIAAQDQEKFLVVSGETPVAFTLPAGTRIWLGLDKVHEHPLRISGGDNIAGRFMDAVRTPNIGSANGAVAYSEVGSSRRVYFGFSESSWQFEQKNIYTLLDDVLNWLHRRPVANLANWPFPYRAAQIVEMDTEKGFPNAIHFADMLDSNGFQGTFYCLTSVAKLYPDIVKRLEHKHEIAYHGDVHDAFKGQSREIQSNRLETMQQELRLLVSDPSKLRGFRPPYELADQVVESLLHEKGFGHILTNSDNTEAMLPYLSPVSPKEFQKGLIVLPRTQRDDMNFIREGIDSSDMTKAMNGDFDRAREYGALGVLSVHSQNFEADSPVAISLAQFLNHIKSSGNMTWVASSGTIESWWRNRAQFKSNLSGDSKRMLLNITVEKPGLNWKTSLVISNPVKGLQPRIKITKVGMTLPLLVPLDDYQTAIVFSPLKPGHYSYYLSY